MNDVTEELQQLQKQHLINLKGHLTNTDLQVLHDNKNSTQYKTTLYYQQVYVFHSH